MPTATSTKKKAPTKKPRAPVTTPRTTRRPELREQEVWPRVDEELVERLERTFPPPSVKPGATPDETMYAAGQHAVVALLREVYEMQRRGLE